MEDKVFITRSEPLGGGLGLTESQSIYDNRNLIKNDRFVREQCNRRLDWELFVVIIDCKTRNMSL